LISHESRIVFSQLFIWVISKIINVVQRGSPDCFNRKLQVTVSFSCLLQRSPQVGVNRELLRAYLLLVHNDVVDASIGLQQLWNKFFRHFFGQNQVTANLLKALSELFNSLNLKSAPDTPCLDGVKLCLGLLSVNSWIKAKHWENFFVSLDLHGFVENVIIMHSQVVPEPKDNSAGLHVIEFLE